MVHGEQRVPILDDTVVLREVLLGEAGLVVRAAQCLAQQLVLPVGCR